MVCNRLNAFSILAVCLSSFHTANVLLYSNNNFPFKKKVRSSCSFIKTIRQSCEMTFIYQESMVNFLTFLFVHSKILIDAMDIKIVIRNEWFYMADDICEKHAENISRNRLVTRWSKKKKEKRHRKSKAKIPIISSYSIGNLKGFFFFNLHNSIHKQKLCAFIVGTF